MQALNRVEEAIDALRRGLSLGDHPRSAELLSELERSRARTETTSRHPDFPEGWPGESARWSDIVGRVTHRPVERSDAILGATLARRLISFRIQVYASDGTPLQVRTVELAGTTVSGTVLEKDWVQVPAQSATAGQGLRPTSLLNLTTGEAVTVDERPDDIFATPESKRRWMRVGLGVRVVFFLIILAFVAVMWGVMANSALLEPRRASEVPDVIGMPVDEAEDVLADEGFTEVRERQVVRPDLPPFQVVRTDPPGGTDWKHGDVVTIFFTLPQ
jgi:hypothetical protein